MIWRFLPLIGVLLFAGIAFVWRPWLQRRRYGTRAIVLFASASRGQRIRDGLAVVFLLLLLGQSVVAVAWPERLSPLVQDRSTLEILRATGAALLERG